MDRNIFMAGTIFLISVPEKVIIWAKNTSNLEEAATSEA
jgi:hypothetical protein